MPQIYLHWHFRKVPDDYNILILNGRGERIRTSDPLVPNQVLYQAEPLPEHGLQSRICGGAAWNKWPLDALH